MPYTTCFMCQRTTQCDTHHLLPGSNRRKSDKLGLVVHCAGSATITSMQTLKKHNGSKPTGKKRL